ncbi:alpha-ketoglutarate-dependent dioxygenase AlkB family protein [Hoeflea sp. Naph1]|uniref:alpha-ketoglutarate-dependent dioxygenase AlkB family protein n=1 Tax=Hoeflea sp. Naph1 TaxID=3388653 RepID=UPI0039902AFD
MLVLPKGLRHIPDHIDRAGQQALLEEIRAVVRQAPLYRPEMPRSGKPFSVRMSNCGDLGWVADRNGYRYQTRHPVTDAPWPPIPQLLLDMWRELTGDPRPPQACLINYYDTSARMGLHQDRDENDLSAPVLSVSLGDSCLFRFGGTERTQPTKSFRLESGDIVVLGGESRLIFHGVDRIHPMTSTLLADGGRINLTLRRVGDR